ncbi:MAG: hypothetical protein ABH885_00350 [Candidatus Omnitrophota bacterium]
MNMDLSGIIEKIKKEGVAEAEQEAQGIIGQARQKAGVIVKDAEGKKNEIIKEAKGQADVFRESSERAIRQAARDVVLALRERVTDFFDRIVKNKVSEALTPDVLQEAIIKMVRNFARDKSCDVEVLLNEADRQKIEKALFDELKKEAKARLELRGYKGIEKGFRIGVKGEDSYFDFTDEGIAEALKAHLNPKLVEILDIDLGLGRNGQNA